MALWASSHALATATLTGPGWTGHVVTPTPDAFYTPSNPAAPSCTNEAASVFMLRPVAHGELFTALSEASFTITGLPAVPCSVVAALPTPVHGDLASLETKWSNWWQTAR